jgi:bacillithiol biosynthesis cysteine-adding enzyme BshC
VQTNPSTPSRTAAAASALSVDVRRFRWIRRLAADYVYDFDALAPFFAGNPADPRDWAASIARTQAHPRDRARIATIVATQQLRRHAPPEAIDAAGRLGDGATVAIVTGQQAGLFGGPLFTLLKALTAIKLAAQVSREHGVAAVPVFWVDAEDHDWDEVRACTVFDQTLAPRAISLPQPNGLRDAPVAAVQLDESVARLIAELESFLQPTEFRHELLAGLRAEYATGRGMADAFGRWLERVLGDRGLVVYDASDPASKPLVGNVFARELATAGTTARLASEAGGRLSARGYHMQVQLQSEGPALFRLGEGRQPITARDGEFVVGDRIHSAAALVNQAASAPAGFSPNVLLRPIVQDSIFPTACYVAGPNELAYLGQLRGVYAHFGVPMPLIYPRVSATIVDSAAFRFLTRYNVPFETLQARDEAALNELLRAQIPAAVDASFAAAARAIEAEMAPVCASVPAVDPTLEGAARSTLARMQHDLETLHGKVIQAAKRRDETLKRQFTHARALAFPNGHPQEREIGFVSFLNQYGPALVDRLGGELPLDLGCHWIVQV